MARKYRNPSGLYEITVGNGTYIIDTGKPDFRMDYQVNHEVKKQAPFSVLSKEPIPMPDRKNELGYLCVCTTSVKKWDTFPVYVVRKKKIKFKKNDGTRARVFEYVCVPFGNKVNRNQGRITKKIS